MSVAVRLAQHRRVYVSPGTSMVTLVCREAYRLQWYLAPPLNVGVSMPLTDSQKNVVLYRETRRDAAEEGPPVLTVVSVRPPLPRPQR